MVEPTLTDGRPFHVRRLTTPELTAREVTAIRRLLWDAFAEDEFGGFTEDDWQHALGGLHVVAMRDGEIVGHSSVVERALEINGRPVRSGYVEAVAVDPRHQRQGVGTALMEAVNEHVIDQYELGALGTGSQAFYERLGWQVWQGPSGVRTPDGDQPTPDEDGYILVLPTPASSPLRLTDRITCDWRPGDVW